MNKNTISSTIAIFSVLLLTAGVGVAPAYAQVSSDGSCCSDAGYTDYSSVDAGYTDYSVPSAGYTDYSIPSAGYTDYSVPSAGYTDYYANTYSAPRYYSAPSYRSAGYYTSPSISVTAPRYYSTSVSAPIAVSIPYGGSNHTTTPAPITYVTPTQTQTQTQTQTSQPITIVNNNTNNNNNSSNNANTNNTPAVQPVVQYVYPQQNYNYVAPSRIVSVNPVVATSPYVTLSQIPYTGYDFGTVGNAIYWGALLAFAGAAAYLLFYFRGGAFNLATAFGGRRTGIRPMNFIEKEYVPAQTPTTQVADEVAEVVEPVLSPIQNLPIVESRRGTFDSMNIVHGSGNEAPRLVIARA